MEQSPEAGRRALFDEYCGYVYAICANKLRNCGTSEDVDECLSDTFAAVFRYLDSASGKDGDLKGIIGTIANRTVSIDSENFRELSSEIRVEEAAERSALRETVLDCIKRLGEPDSSIIVYFYYYGKKTKQIAPLVELTDSAVQKRLSRARKKLEELLREAGITGEGYV